MSNILYNFTNVQGIITKVSLVLFQTNREVIKQELIYRGEGNANIVISIPEKRQILRIQKTEQPQTFLLWFIDWIVNILNLNNRNRIKNDCQDLSFYRNIMMPLLGEFVCEATPVFFSKKQTSDLSKAITQSRPNQRRPRPWKMLHMQMFYLFYAWEMYASPALNVFKEHIVYTVYVFNALSYFFYYAVNQ